MLELYIRDGKPTRELQAVRRHIESWQATLPHPVDISSWPDEVIANLDMAVRHRLASAMRTVANPFDVSDDRYSLITSQVHRDILLRLFARAKMDVAPIDINGKSYTLSAARDVLDAVENMGRAS